MHVNSKIYFKLELTKNNNKQLNFNIHFNPNAQNITIEEHTISWNPTKEEQSFLLEALKLLQHQYYDNTIIFNKKYNEYQTSDEEDVIQSIDGKYEEKEKNKINIANESRKKNYWESIDSDIDKKLKIHNL